VEALQAPDARAWAVQQGTFVHRQAARRPGGGRRVGERRVGERRCGARCPACGASR
jgi:hypothetical protein